MRTKLMKYLMTASPEELMKVMHKRTWKFRIAPNERKWNHRHTLPHWFCIIAAQQETEESSNLLIPYFLIFVKYFSGQLMVIRNTYPHFTEKRKLQTFKYCNETVSKDNLLVKERISWSIGQFQVIFTSVEIHFIF